MKHCRDSLRLFGQLLKDIFGSDKKNEISHGWCRFPINVKNKYEQVKILSKISKEIRAKQIIKDDSKKRQ
jgi:hypothetical protein